MTAFPDFYRGPHLQKLLFTTFNGPDSEFAALQAGSIDVMEWPLKASQISALSSLSPWSYQLNYSYSGVINIPFDAGRFPSNYSSYRRAVSYMIDRDDVVVTALQGRGVKMPDQLSPDWPASWRVPGGIGYDKDLSLANSTLYADGWRYTCRINPDATGCGGNSEGLGGYWFNLNNPATLVNVSTTIFYSRSEDPLRNYIGVQLQALQSATKSTYHFDRLFTVLSVTSYVTSRTVYQAPTSPGGGYSSNNCNGSGYPCFTAYTQGLSRSFPDPDVFYYNFSNDTSILDQPYFNFGHYVNNTVNSDVNTMKSSLTLDDSLVRKINFEVTQQAWVDPIFSTQEWTGSSERVTGFLSAQNSVSSDSFFWNDWFSYWRAHLKGRTFGGSLQVGIYNPLNQLNIFNPDSNWVYDFQVLNRIYDTLGYFDRSTGSLIPGLAYNINVAGLTNPNLPTGIDYSHWQPSTLPPYWDNLNGARETVASGMRVDLRLYPNATWHDGTPITSDDVIWNVITDVIDAKNLQGTFLTNVADVNVTNSHTVTLWFNQTSWNYPYLAAQTPMVPPTPWVRNRDWIANHGIISDINLSTKASLNLTAGSLNMLDGSGSFKFDYNTPGDPFTTGNTFDLLANGNWIHTDPARSNYDSGIVVMNPLFPPLLLLPPCVPSYISFKVAIVNSSNSEGLVFSDGDYLPDPSTVSDTTNANVTVSYYEDPSTRVQLTYNSTSRLYEGNLPSPSSFKNDLHFQITATTSHSSTTYGPVGSSQASATGISWEGDLSHTSIRISVTTCAPLNPTEVAFTSIITLLAVTVILRKETKPRHL